MPKLKKAIFHTKLKIAFFDLVITLPAPSQSHHHCTPPHQIYLPPWPGEEGPMYPNEKLSDCNSTSHPAPISFFKRICKIFRVWKQIPLGKIMKTTGGRNITTNGIFGFKYKGKPQRLVTTTGQLFWYKCKEKIHNYKCHSTKDICIFHGAHCVGDTHHMTACELPCKAV